MKKSEIVEHVGREVAMRKGAAEAAVDAVLSTIAGSLARGEDVAVAGFGRFSRKSRPAREGRNPRTGEPVSIGPSATVSFKAARALKDALNGRRPDGARGARQDDRGTAGNRPRRRGRGL